MVCKACNSHVHNTNDMTLVHLNECFNGKFNDDHCSIQNYLYCFSCKTATSVHNCYIVGLGLNCKFIDLLFKHSVLKFIKISSFIVSLFQKLFIVRQTHSLKN